MDRRIYSSLRILGAIVVAIIVLSIASGYASLPMMSKANAQAVSFTFNGRPSENLHPAKVIRIDIFGDFGGAPKLRLAVVNVTTGEFVEVVTRDGVNGTFFNATLIAPNRYVAYLGGNLVNLTVNPAAPIVGNDSIVRFNVSTVNRGTSYVIRIVGPDIDSPPIVFDTVASVAVLPAREFAYRRNAIININYTDLDLNKDPTKVETLTGDDLGNISVSITVIKAAGGSVSVDTNLSALVVAGFTSTSESGVNTGSYVIPTSILNISMVLGYNISRDDRVILVFRTLGGIQGGLADRPGQVGQDAFRAVYRDPTISISATFQRVTIDIISPDDNANPRAMDTLDTGTDFGFDPATVVVTVAGRSVIFNASEVRETGANTGVFRISFSVVWGSDFSINKTTMTITIKNATDGPFSISVRYNVTTRDPGYNIDASNSTSLRPSLASIDVVKASVKTWILNITKPELNNDPNKVEVLSATVATANASDFILSKDGIALARFQVLDVAGALIPLSLSKAVGDPADFIVFAETDFNSGIFVLSINATNLRIQPGQTLIIRYFDLAGFTRDSGKIEKTVTVSLVAISLDRSVYPVNRDSGVAIYVTYSNDFYDTDPTRIDRATVNIKIITVGNRTSYEVNDTLDETGINTGIFSKRIVIPSTVFATPEVVGARLEVADLAFTLPGGDNPRATATFQPNPASISVNATIVAFGETLEITVVDPDGNWDSRRVNSITVTIPAIGKTITLSETGANTGVFKGVLTITWDDPDLERKVFPGDTLTVQFVDRTPLISPTATAWNEVPYTASFKIKSTTGVLMVRTAFSGMVISTTTAPATGFVGPLETFSVIVRDPDLSRYTTKANMYTPENYISLRGGIVAFSVEGIPTVVYRGLNETAIGSKEFAAIGPINLREILRSAGILTGTEDAWTLAARLAEFVGRKIVISYIDLIDETGSRSIINAILTIRAANPSISTDKEFVNIGETLTINVSNIDIAGAEIPEYKTVVITSTSMPAGQQFFMVEIAPGVFQVNLTVVDPGAWIPGAPQIPARLGDTITITYFDPVTADGRSRVPFNKTVIVGRFLERPAEVSGVDLLDPATGAPTIPKVNVPVLISVNLSNIDVIDRYMTAIVIVRDARNVTVALFAGATTVPAGKSVILSFQWIPFAPGTYTIEVIVVKTFTDRTPLAPETFRRTITVTS